MDRQRAARLSPSPRLPLTMLEDADSAPLFGGLFKNRLLWLGFAVPLLIHSWNSLNYYHDAFQPIALVWPPIPAPR